MCSRETWHSMQLSYCFRLKFWLVSFTNFRLLQLVDGKISIDGFKALGVKKYGDNAKAIGIFNEIVDECANVSGSDNCELTGNLIQCVHEAAVKRGIDIKKGIQA